MNKSAILLVIFLYVASCSYAEALKCYECSSKNNTKCGDPFKAKDTLTECPPAPVHIHHLVNHTEARYCRKLKQTIDGKHQIVTRSCGYLSNNETDKATTCIKDAFSSYTSSIYCSCMDERCNGANAIHENFLLTLAIALTYKVVSCFLTAT